MRDTWRQIAQPEEKEFLQKLLAAQSKAEKQYRCIATDFYARAWMDQVILQYLGQQYHNTLKFFGGYEDAERQSVIFGVEEDFEVELPIGALCITVKTGIGKPLTHRDFLGTLLGLGIERSKIGDILIEPFGAYVIVNKELEDYISCHLTHIGRYGQIEIESIGFDEIALGEKKVKEITGTVQSLRADSIFALAFGMPRGGVVKLLQADKGKCNGMPVKVADLLKEGDIGTLRGYGKMKLVQINGQTKKDRTHIKIEKYI